MKQASNDNEAGGKTTGGGRKCPLCQRPTKMATRPFCSKRCADLDLGRWLNGSYAIHDQADWEEDERPALPTIGKNEEGSSE